MKTFYTACGQPFVVDDEDEPLALSLAWYARRGDQDNTTYVQAAVEGQTVCLHREILGAPDDMLVDHVNRDGLDNRRENLRLCSHSENQYNAKRRKDNTSGYKNVRYDKINRKWVARLQVAGKPVHLGCFRTAEEANAAAIVGRLKYHGAFARDA